MSDEWIEVGTGPTWDFKEEKELMGTYVSKEEGVGQNNSNLYNIKKADGSVIGVWGNTMLDDKFKKIQVGESIKIVYLGMEKSKAGKQYHNYKVFHRATKVNQTPNGEVQENATDPMPF